MPLIVGAGAAGHANLPVVLLITSAVSGFLARVPAEMAFRGKARRGARAAWAFLFGSIAAGGVIALLAYYERWWLLPLGLSIVVGPAALVSFRALRVRWRDLGELLVVASFSSLAPAAHYASVGSLKAPGLALWLLSALYGWSSVLYIRMLLEKRSPSSADARPGRRSAVIIYHIALMALVALLVLTGGAPPLVAVAFAPLLAKVTYRVVRLPDHLDIQKTGLFEASQAAVFAILLVAAYQVG